MDDIKRVLQHTAFCRHMHSSDVEQLSRYIDCDNFSAGTVLYCPGDAADKVYIILSGRVQITGTTHEQHSTAQRICRNGDFFGEHALLEDAVRDHSATCLDDCTLYSLHTRDYIRLTEEHPRVAGKMLSILSDKLKSSTRSEIPSFTGHSLLGSKIVSFVSAKGGVGKTFLAANFAALAALRNNFRVCLIETDLQFGDLSSFFGERPPKTLWDIVCYEELHSVHPQLLLNYATAPLPGLHVFHRPRHITEAEQIEPLHIASLVNHLQRISELVVIDCRTGFDELTLTSLDVSDIVFAVTGTDFSNVAATTTMLNILRSLRYSQGKVKVIANQSSPARDIHGSQQDELFDFETVATFSYEPRIFESLNENKLWCQAAPAHCIPTQLTVLARNLDGPIPSFRQERDRAKVTFLQKWLNWFGTDSGQRKLDVPLLSHRHVEESTSHGRRNAMAEVALGQAYYLVGRYDVASRAFERAIELDGTLDAAHYYLGEIASFNHDPQAARAHFSAACDANPNCLRYRVKLALQANPPNELAHEIQTAQKIVAENPQFADLRFLLAQLYYHAGQKDECRQELSSALELNPRYADALAFQGMVFRQAHNSFESLQSLLSALKSNPSHVVSLYELGHLFCELRLYAFARDTYRRLLGIYSSHVSTHRALLELQDPLRVLKKEVVRYSEALELHPGFGDMRFKLSLAYFQLGELEKSRIQLEKANKSGFDKFKVEEMLDNIDWLIPMLCGTFLLPQISEEYEQPEKISHGNMADHSKGPADDRA